MKKISFFFLFFFVTYILIAKNTSLTNIAIYTNNVTELVTSNSNFSTLNNSSHTNKFCNHFSFNKSNSVPKTNIGSKITTPNKEVSHAKDTLSVHVFIKVFHKTWSIAEKTTKENTISVI